MISRQTAEGLLEVLFDWARRNHVPFSSVHSLLEDLKEVQGNKSFRDSVKALHMTFGEMTYHGGVSHGVITRGLS